MKLARLLHSFTVEVADKVVRNRLINEEKNAYDGAIRLREKEIADEERRFKEEEFERMKQGDQSSHPRPPPLFACSPSYAYPPPNPYMCVWH